MKFYLQLFWTFLKIGAFTFGGGWAMVPLIERELVDRFRWLDRAQFLDSLAVAQSLPGVLAVNISVLAGNRLRGLKGSVVAALGAVLPSFVIILLIALFFSGISHDPVVERIFKGIRPAVVALILAPVFSTAKSCRLTWKTYWIPVVVALAVWALGISPVWLILAGAAGGIGYRIWTLRTLNDKTPPA